MFTRITAVIWLTLGLEIPICVDRRIMHGRLFAYVG